MIVADYDRDGKLDLYVTTIGVTKTATWIKGEGGGQVRNRLWRNLGNWEFADVTESSGASGGNRSTFTAVWLDADEDGWPDLYVINEFGERRPARQPGGTGPSASSRSATTPATSARWESRPATSTTTATSTSTSRNMYSKAGNRVIGNLWPGTYPETILAMLRSFTTGSQLHHNLGGLKFEQDRPGARRSPTSAGPTGPPWPT